MIEDFSGKWEQSPSCGYSIVEEFDFYENDSDTVPISYDANGFIRVADPTSATWEEDQGKIYVSTDNIDLVDDVTRKVTYKRYVKVFLCVDDDENQSTPFDKTIEHSEAG